MGKVRNEAVAVAEEVTDAEREDLAALAEDEQGLLTQEAFGELVAQINDLIKKFSERGLVFVTIELTKVPNYRDRVRPYHEMYEAEHELEAESVVERHFLRGHLLAFRDRIETWLNEESETPPEDAVR